MSELLAPYGAPDDGAHDLAVTRPPEKIIGDASRVAGALKAVIEQTKGSVKLGQSEHLRVEAWSTLAQFYGCSPRVTRTQFVDFGGGVQGFEAFAELVHVASGRVVSTAEAMCLTDEPLWRERAAYEWRDNVRVEVGQEPVPLFQLRSMAQTRATSKVCATALRWVVVLAGYSGTPAEEMTGRETSAQGPSMTAPQRKSEAAPAPGEQVIYTGTVTDMSTKTGTTKAGKPWTLWRITLSGGQTVSTFSESLAKRAGEIRASGAVAEWVCKVSAKGGYDLEDIAVTAANTAAEPMADAAVADREPGADDELGF